MVVIYDLPYCLTLNSSSYLKNLSTGLPLSEQQLYNLSYVTVKVIFSYCQRLSKIRYIFWSNITVKTNQSTNKQTNQTKRLTAIEFLLGKQQQQTDKKPPTQSERKKSSHFWKMSRKTAPSLFQELLNMRACQALESKSLSWGTSTPTWILKSLKSEASNLHLGFARNQEIGLVLPVSWKKEG